MKTLLLLLIAFAPSLRAQDTAAPNMQHISTAAAWLSSAEPAKRKAAISTFRTMPASAMVHYKTALEAARKANVERLKQLDSGKNPLTEHEEFARQLTDERKRVMALILTDYEKDERKIQMLREEMEALITLYTKREKLAQGDHTRSVTTLQSAIDAICEITREQEKLNPQQDTSELSEAELREQIIKDNTSAERLTQCLTSLNKSKQEISLLADAEKHNSQQGNWCNGSMKSFATILNYERAIMGLPPLRIEEKLSAAAAGHSSDMASGGFFAHESPVPNKKMPQDRAQLANFAGNVRGENIFMGSASPQAAYDAWFGSDGHRFIMFGDGPNCCGIGISGIHWTLMTGKN